MSWRNIIVSNPAKLSTKNHSLIVKQTEEMLIPLEDIATIMLESQQITITSRLMADLTKYNILLFSCNEAHLPVGVYTPFNNHSRSLKVVNMQVNLSLPFKKRCWQRIIKVKILNQSHCLQLSKKEGWEHLQAIAKSVQSGDKNNREAYAARAYFKYLYGDDFVRSNSNVINSALNYGYAIIRGAIARSIVVYGFNPVWGIHHHSELNTFNLADDFIEVYRPLVDFYVVSNIDLYEGDELSREFKIGLYNLLNVEIIVDNSIYSVLASIDLLLKSFSTACMNNNAELLKLPQLISLEVHKYE